MSDNNVVDLMTQRAKKRISEEANEPEYEPTIEDYESFLLVADLIRSKSSSNTAKVEVDEEFLNIYIDHHIEDEEQNEMMLRTESVLLFDWDTTDPNDDTDGNITLTQLAVELKEILEELHYD